MEIFVDCFIVAADQLSVFGRVVPSQGTTHGVGQSIGLGYIRNPEGLDDKWITDGTYELEVATERVSAQVHNGALYDPAMEQIKS